MALATRVDGVTFLHSGKLGDIVFAMACVPKGSTLYLTSKPWLTPPLTQEQFNFINSLIPVKWWDGEKIDHDFTGFRMHYRKGVNLAQQQADYVGLPMRRPWLTVRPKWNEFLVARSIRYRHPRGNEMWKDVLRRYKPARFIGTPEEHQSFVSDFGPIDRAYTPTMKDMAEEIAGCQQFIGNQSLPLSLAVALGRPCIVEHSPSWDDCRFDGVQYPLA